MNSLPRVCPLRRVWVDDLFAILETSFFLFPLALFLLLPFWSSIPSKTSVSQKLRRIVSNVVTIYHRFRAQQVDIPLCFRRWWRTRFLPTFLSSFPRRASTASSSASAPAFAWFPYFSRLVTVRLRKIEKYTQFVATRKGKVNKR